MDYSFENRIVPIIFAVHVDTKQLRIWKCKFPAKAWPIKPRNLKSLCFRLKDVFWQTATWTIPEVTILKTVACSMVAKFKEIEDIMMTKRLFSLAISASVVAFLAASCQAPALE